MQQGVSFWVQALVCKLGLQILGNQENGVF